MELNAHDDIEAPIEYVFTRVTDFPAFERSIMRRGGDVERLEGGDAPTVGRKWRIKFVMRRKERTVNAVLTDVDAPNGITLNLRSSGVDGQIVTELVALSRARTRLTVTMQANAKTIPAKLLFQSLHFAQGRTDKRFRSIVSTFAEDVEARFRA